VISLDINALYRSRHSSLSAELAHHMAGQKSRTPRAQKGRTDTSTTDVSEKKETQSSRKSKRIPQRGPKSKPKAQSPSLPTTPDASLPPIPETYDTVQDAIDALTTVSTDTPTLNEFLQSTPLHKPALELLQYGVSPKTLFSLWTIKNQFQRFKALVAEGKTSAEELVLTFKMTGLSDPFTQYVQRSQDSPQEPPDKLKRGHGPTKLPSPRPASQSAADTNPLEFLNLSSSPPKDDSLSLKEMATAVNGDDRIKRKANGVKGIEGEDKDLEDRNIEDRNIEAMNGSGLNGKKFGRKNLRNRRMDTIGLDGNDSVTEVHGDSAVDEDGDEEDEKHDSPLTTPSENLSIEHPLSSMRIISLPKQTNTSREGSTFSSPHTDVLPTFGPVEDAEMVDDNEAMNAQILQDSTSSPHIKAESVGPADILNCTNMNLSQLPSAEADVFQDTINPNLLVACPPVSPDNALNPHSFDNPPEYPVPPKDDIDENFTDIDTTPIDGEESNTRTRPDVPTYNENLSPAQNIEAFTEFIQQLIAYLSFMSKKPTHQIAKRVFAAEIDPRRKWNMWNAYQQYFWDTPEEIKRLVDENDGLPGEAALKLTHS
jgi:hypothetical protein